jgi:hypothetical protein
MIYKHFLILVIGVLFAVLFVTPNAGANSCLPEFEIKSAEKVCSSHADCVRVGDACRSCGPALYANKKFKSEIELRDNKAREAVKCVLACEACAKWLAQGACVKGECVAPPIK